MFAIERDANAIGQQTRRGKGNIVICSADVASALQMAGVLDYTPALNNNLNVDDTSTTFAGVMNGRYKVYVDPYSAMLLQVSTMLLDIKVLHLMMLVSSTAHMFHYKWFVQLVRTASSPKLVSRPVMVWLLTHLPVLVQRPLIQLPQSHSQQIQMLTIVGLKLQTYVRIIKNLTINLGELRLFFFPFFI